MKKVTIITGDGIGPEIVESVKRVFEAAGVQIEWEEVMAGESAYEECGELLPKSTLESIKKNKVALKAPLNTPIGKGFRSVNVQLRKELDLYANIRPVITLEGVRSKYDNIDLLVVRENTEGLYSGVEHHIGKDAAETIKITTRSASERIARYAMSLAMNRQKRKVTVVHKANIQKFTDGLFLESAKEMHIAFKPFVELDDKIVDNMCMQLVQYPERYDVLLCPNFYGDILSDLCAGLVGGLGVAPGANIGDEYAVYEAIHGTAPDIAGQNLANPTSLLLSAVMMLRDKNIGDLDNANRIENAINSYFERRKSCNWRLRR